MERIELEKNIQLDNMKELLQVSVDDKIDYYDVPEGLKVVGKIKVYGMYNNENGIEKKFCESIDVDIFIENENIIDKKDLKMIVDDFDYIINDDKITLKIYLHINSYKEIETTFPSVELVENPIITKDEEIEVINNMEQEDDKIETRTSIPFLSDFLDEKVYYNSACFHVYNGESLQTIADKYKVKVNDLKQINNKDNYTIGELINIPLKRHE